MYRFKKIIIISVLAIVVASVMACAGPTPASSPAVTTPASAPPSSTSVTTVPSSTTPVAITTVPVTTAVISQPPVTKPAVTTPSPVSSPTASPVASATPVIDPNAKFFIQKEIIGYNRTPKIDGTYDETPIYQDLFLELKEIARFAPSDAIFVPRIPTITNHDDWFLRYSVPSSSVKPWIVNWGYSIKPGDKTTTLTLSIVNQEQFEANYYNNPLTLSSMDIKTGDKGISGNGIYSRLMQSYGNYVILWRTNNASGVVTWWIRIGM